MFYKVEVVDYIKDLIDEHISSRTTKLKNYGYYSFSLKDLSYHDKLAVIFNRDDFKIVTVEKYKEYSIVYFKDDIEHTFRLEYKSDKKSSKLILY